MILQMIEEDANFVVSGLETTLDTLGSHPNTSPAVLQWAHALAKSKYAREIKEMTLKTSGWHFSVLNADATQLESFDMNEMAHKMASQSPYVWDLWKALLASDPVTEKRRLWHLLRKRQNGAQQKKRKLEGSCDEDEDEDEFLIDDDNDIEVGNGTEFAANSGPVQRRKELLKMSPFLDLDAKLTSS